MPTTARLVAAILMAALGWLAAELVKPYLPEAQPVGLFSPISAGIGVLVGWTFTGRRLQAGTGTAAGIGLAGAALLVFWVTLIFAGYEMTRRSLRVIYDGSVEALQDMVEIAVDDLKMAAQIDVVLGLVLGGLAVGAITQWVARRFR